MEKPVNVLVTGAGGNVGQGIIKSLRMSRLKAVITAADIYPMAPGIYRADYGYTVPPVKKEGAYLERLLLLCRRQRIDAVLIGVDAELPFFARHKEIIEKKSGARVIVSPQKQIDIATDKWHTAEFLKAEGLNFPLTALLSDTKAVTRMLAKKGARMVVKPRIGRGSRDVYLVSSQADLKRLALQDKPAYILQECIADENSEYTIGSFSEGQKIYGVIVIKRQIYQGTSYRMEILHHAKIAAQAEEILRRLRPWGPCNIQGRYSAGKFIPFEINLRFSGTSAVRSFFGFNEAESAIRRFVLGEKIGKLSYRDGVASRFWEELYLSNADLRQVRHKGYIKGPRGERTEF